MSRYGIEHKKKRFFYFNVPLKERALQAEIARLKLVEEKYEEEMARKEKEVAEGGNRQAWKDASCDLLEELYSRYGMKLKKKNSSIESLKKELNDSKVECEKVRSSQYNLIVREQSLEARLRDLDKQIGRMKPVEDLIEREQALEARQRESMNEIARLKKVEEKYIADQAWWSVKIETDHNSLGQIRMLSKKVEEQEKELSHYRRRLRSPAAEDKDARIAILLDQVNWLKEELDRWRPSPAAPSNIEGGELGRGCVRGRYGRRRQGRRL